MTKEHNSEAFCVEHNGFFEGIEIVPDKSTSARFEILLDRCGPNMTSRQRARIYGKIRKGRYNMNICDTCPIPSTIRREHCLGHTKCQDIAYDTKAFNEDLDRILGGGQ